MEQTESLTEEELQKRYKLLHYKVQSQRLKKVWMQFEQAGFKPLLIKGWAAAQVYPNPSERQYSDIDLIIEPAHFREAESYVKKEKFDAAVDLHRGARHLDSLSFADLYANSVLKKCENTQVRVLREEDHLRILCVHWLNDGGADRERLWDIYYAVENRSGNFDWERCLGAVSEKRRRWIVCTIGLAHLYLNLKVENTPVAGEVNNLPSWLIRAVEREWRSGVRLIPLEMVLRDKKRLWQQIKKRMPPNPVQATIELDGKFDWKPRFIYQFADIFKSLPPSLEKIVGGRLYERLNDRNFKK